jgi:hypothetical protein
MAYGQDKWQTGISKATVERMTGVTPRCERTSQKIRCIIKGGKDDVYRLFFPAQQPAIV